MVPHITSPADCLNTPASKVCRPRQISDYSIWEEHRPESEKQLCNYIQSFVIVGRDSSARNQSKNNCGSQAYPVLY